MSTMKIEYHGRGRPRARDTFSIRRVHQEMKVSRCPPDRLWRPKCGRGYRFGPMATV